MKAIKWAVLGIAASLSAGCSGQDREDTSTSTEALYDAATQDATATLAMRDAFDQMIGTGNLYEYCGLIVRKANGQYRAGAPVTQGSQTLCQASISYAAGERITGYYHSHPDGVVPDFSGGDISNSESTGRMYYLVDYEGYTFRYNPATNQTVWLGDVY
jgi:proteasome lid subunit RPN8/RPN11